MEENKNDVLFGTAVFGGFNRKNVIEYIEKLQEKLAANSDAEDTRQVKRLEQAEAELSDAKAQIRALTSELERANAEKAELSEKLKAVPPQEIPDKLTEVQSSLQEVTALLEQVTQLKAQLRVEQAANELLNERIHEEQQEVPAAEDENEPEEDDDAQGVRPQNSPASLDEVDTMVQEYLR